jgi:hypothetical protein
LLEVQETLLLNQEILEIQEEFQEQELILQEKVVVVVAVQALLEQIMLTLIKELQVVQD